MVVADAVDFDERLRVPPSWWALSAAAGVAVWLVLVVVAPLPLSVLCGAGAAAAVAATLSRWGAVRISVETGSLRAGRAVIPLSLCGPAAALDETSTRDQFGPHADARAFLLLRPYVTTSVRVEVADEADPTPYWLLSSRRPADLAAAVNGGSLSSSE